MFRALEELYSRQDCNPNSEANQKNIGASFEILSCQSNPKATECFKPTQKALLRKLSNGFDRLLKTAVGSKRSVCGPKRNDYYGGYAVMYSALGLAHELCLYFNRVLAYLLRKQMVAYH